MFICDLLLTESSSTNITSQVLFVSVKNILIPNFALTADNRFFIEYIHSRVLNTNFISAELDCDTHHQIPSRMIHRRSQKTIQAFAERSRVLWSSLLLNKTQLDKLKPSVPRLGLPRDKPFRLNFKKVNVNLNNNWKMQLLCFIDDRSNSFTSSKNNAPLSITEFQSF